ncbi:MAG: hypothetical protein ACRD2L_09275 [Terriglobia bacterium]
MRYNTARNHDWLSLIIAGSDYVVAEEVIECLMSANLNQTTNIIISYFALARKIRRFL